MLEMSAHKRIVIEQELTEDTEYASIESAGSPLTVSRIFEN